MSWKQARFNDSDVWVQLSDTGEVVVQGGRVPMRYNLKASAKVYLASVKRVTIPDGAEVAEVAGSTSAGGRGRGFGSAGTRSSAQAAAAKEDAQSLIAGLPDGTAVVYTDGSCRGNPGPAGSGAVIELPDGRRFLASRALGQGTNNVAELEAIGLALDVLDQAEVPLDAPVAILSDSDYTSGVLIRGWKAKKNRELILGLRERLRERPGVALHWVAGHVGLPGNEQADALANEGVDGRTDIRLAP